MLPYVQEARKALKQVFMKGRAISRDEPRTIGAHSADGAHETRGELATTGNWGEPDWSILDDRRGDLPDFPINGLSPAWRAWIVRAAHGAGVTPGHIAVPLLGVLGGLIGTARRVRASRSWSEPLTLWSCIVASSGDRKTPALQVTLRALDLIEKTNSAAIDVARHTHETKAQRYKETIKQWKNDRQAALDANRLTDRVGSIKWRQPEFGTL
jgi:hypothetical protein